MMYYWTYVINLYYVMLQYNYYINIYRFIKFNFNVYIHIYVIYNNILYIKNDRDFFL